MAKNRRNTMNAEEKKDDGFIDHSAAYEAQHEAWHGDAAGDARHRRRNQRTPSSKDQRPTRRSSTARRSA